MKWMKWNELIVCNVGDVTVTAVCVCVHACAVLLVPVSDVFIVSGENLRHVTDSDNDVVHLRELQQRVVGCVAVVKSRLVRPTLRVTVDGTDWTRLFVESEAQHSLPPANNSIVAPVNAVFRRLYVTMKPERHFNGHTLECSASTDGFPPVSATASVTVEC